MPLSQRLAAALLLACSARACVVDEDCSLTGVCAPGGACVCDAGWRGADCGALDLAPATHFTGYNLTALGTSSWGGKTVRDPHNSSLFHLFAAELTGGCGLDYWSPMSRIIRAEGASPAGPFEFAAEVAGTFAHNPTVIWSPSDKLYLMYHIGCPFAAPATCGAPQFSCDPGNNNNGESGITLRTSPDLRTWTSHGIVLGVNGSAAWDVDTTNPSAAVMEGGSVLLAYRGCALNCASDELLSLAAAQSYAGPYTRLTGAPVIPNSAEDPHVWRDARGNWHLLMHSLEPGGGFGDGPKVGRHAFSRGLVGAPWRFNDVTLAYNTTVAFTDGPSLTYLRRERPQLFFADDGTTPLYLTTGVQPVGSGQSFTLVQPLGTAAAWERARARSLSTAAA